MTGRYQDDAYERDLRDAGRGHLSMFGPTVDRDDLERKKAKEDKLWANEAANLSGLVRTWANTDALTEGELLRTTGAIEGSPEASGRKENRESSEPLGSPSVSVIREVNVDPETGEETTILFTESEDARADESEQDAA